MPTSRTKTKTPNGMMLGRCRRCHLIRLLHHPCADPGCCWPDETCQICFKQIFATSVVTREAHA
jgi:hypothetical protein